MPRKRVKSNTYTYGSITALFKAICDAIRAKSGKEGLINHQDIPAEIAALSTGDAQGYYFYSETETVNDEIEAAFDGVLHVLSWETNITSSFGVIINDGAKNQGTNQYASGNTYCRLININVTKGDKIKFNSTAVYPGYSSKLVIVANVIKTV